MLLLDLLPGRDRSRGVPDGGVLGRGGHGRAAPHVDRESLGRGANGVEADGPVGLEDAAATAADRLSGFLVGGAGRGEHEHGLGRAVCWA